MKPATLTLALVCLTPFAAFSQEKVDLAVVHRIKAEAFENSKVMDHAFYLTDVYGPRLTGSPGYLQAAQWAAKRMQEYGLVNAQLEPWGPFGRSWSFTRFSAHLLEPQYAPLIGYPLAWTEGTEGVASGEPVLAVIKTEQDMEKFKGQLKGKIVLVDPPRELPMLTDAPGRRYTDAELIERSMAPEPGKGREEMPYRDGNGQPVSRRQFMEFRNKLRDFLLGEGILLSIQNPRRGDGGGTLFAQSGGSYEVKDPKAPPAIALTPEHYNRIARLIEKKIPVKVEVEVHSEMTDTAADSFNVVADIPGTSKRDEVVIIGGHLDSWHGATGATDNAAGVAVVMEAARILKALNLPLARTVRVALWSAEEQGLLGARGYVKKHYADPEVMKPTADHARVAGYFNLDNGGGKIRGVYLQSNDMMRPLFEAWLAPFRDYGVTAVSIRNTSSTDHMAFDAVGIPAFQFIQEPLEYISRSHHSNMDVYDRLQKGDLMQSAAVLASVVYHAANRPELLPRKPLPKPQPKKEETKPAKAS